MKFLEDFLNRVKQDLKDIDCPNTVFLYDYQPSIENYVKKIEFRGPNPNEFLQKHYIDFLKRLEKNS